MNSNFSTISHLFDGDALQKDLIPGLLNSEELKPVKDSISKQLKKKAIPAVYSERLVCLG